MSNKAVVISSVKIIGRIACYKPDTKTIHDRMIPHFHVNEKMSLSFTGSHYLIPNFVEWLYDRLYRKHGSKVEQLVKLIKCPDEEMQHLIEQGFKKATANYKARKEEKK